MLHRTFNMASDQGDTAPRGLQLALSSENRYCSSSVLASPDSSSSVSIMSDIEASGSPDMLESCPPECSQVDNLLNATVTHGDVQRGATMNMNQTFTAAEINDSMNFWNENMNLMSSEHSGSQKYLTFCKYSEGDSLVAGAAPFSDRKDDQMSSCETSCRGSTENDCCSVSSGEMIVRNNSFCLDDQGSVEVSSLFEAVSASDDIGALPAESGLPSITLPVIIENSPKGIVEGKNNSCLNMTVTQAFSRDCPTEGNDIALSSCDVDMPTENERDLLTTLVCETSTSCEKEETFTGAEPQPLPQTLGAVAQEQSSTFNTESAVRESGKSIQSSTPVDNLVSRRPNLPSLSESPCFESPGSMKTQVGKKHNFVTSKQRSGTGQTLGANKTKTVQIKTFPKTDFSKIKPKIVTRTLHQMAAPDSALQGKASQPERNNKSIETQRETAKNGMTPAKVREGATVASAKRKTVDFAPSRINTKAVNVGAPVKALSAVNEQGERRGSHSDHQPAANDRASADQRSDATCENEQTASQQAGSDNACPEKSPDRCGQIGLRTTPKKVISSKNEVRSGSALGQNKPSVVKTLLRCSSESSSASRTPKEKKSTLKFSTSLTIPRARTHQNRTKAGNLKCSSQKDLAAQAEAAAASTANSREVNRISLVERIGKAATSGASVDGTKSRFQGKTPSRPTRGPLLSQGPVATPKRTPAKLQLGNLGKIDFRTPKASATPPPTPQSGTGRHKVQSSLGTHSAASSRPQLNGSRPAQTPCRPSVIGSPLTPSWKTSRRTPGPSNVSTGAGKRADGSTTPVSRSAGPKPNPLKSVVLKAKLFSAPAKITKPALTPACMPTAANNKVSSNSTPSLLKRSTSARLARPVDKSKSKAGVRQQTPQPPASKPSQSSRPPDPVPPASVAEDERKGHVIQQLRGLLAASNCRFEAVTIVLQQSLAERDEATKQCRELSQELVSLQGELACSVNSSERLEKEKEGLRVTLEDALHRVQEQHQKDLAELEQRLQAFYQAEWNKMHLAYQEEADKCSTVMQQQMGDLKAKHEAMKLDLEDSHTEQLQSVKQQYENSLDELRQVHNQELQTLKKTLKDAEASLSGRIEELTEENDALMEKLSAEENRRKELAQKSQKDPHTLYLEQELESLKVVLDIKTTQLHQQEKKLMEIDKLTEKNMQLDEILKKVQQENEDLKARMERHAALSRQLSTEQAMLQESLQKESKVNKRLSMENEELLWKLNNNDLSSPRKVSPTASSSPSHSFSLQSPRSSGLFSSPPVSPR